MSAKLEDMPSQQQAKVFKVFEDEEPEEKKHQEFYKGSRGGNRGGGRGNQREPRKHDHDRNNQDR